MKGIAFPGVSFVLMALWLSAACNAGEELNREELRVTLDSFFEAVLTGDVFGLDEYVSDECRKKAEFLEQSRQQTVFKKVEIVVPEGAFLLESIEKDRVIASRAPDGPPLLINGQPFEDDPRDDVPLELLRKDGLWRVTNCDDYVPP